MTDAPKTLSKAAQSVQDALRGKGLDAQVLELEATTRTAADAAKAIGCESAQIVKSLVFRTKETDRPILVLASGVNRVSEKAIADQVGERVAKADADFTREATGFAIGGIPPIGHKQHIDTFIDDDLLKYPSVWAAAGTPHAVFSLSPSALRELTGGRIVSIK
jgi:prolyl-tRNA editing enzyme YbaK/EbsC (Cys-tRNA(Pro) deacylase)